MLATVAISPCPCPASQANQRVTGTLGAMAATPDASPDPESDADEGAPPRTLAGERTQTIHGADRASDPTTEGIRERFGAFYVVYVGLFVLLFAYLLTVRMSEALLQSEFQARVDRAIEISRFDRPLSVQIREQVDRAVWDSAWVRWGGLKVNTLVLARDGVTWLYVDGHGLQRPDEADDPGEMLGEWMDQLPATARVEVTLPHNSLISNAILILYSTILLVTVYVSNRRLTSRETERLGDALSLRNQAAQRAAEIEAELLRTRSRLSEIEPVEREQSEAIDALQRERAALHDKLAELAQREETLRSRAATAVDLSQEVRALEDLLEEATGDLASKDEEIDRLEQNLAKASRSTGKARTRAADVLARRFRTLYKTIEIDDRAIDDIAALGDEALRLKAEESVKRLAEEADNVAVRRKVAGLPDHVVAFELGFAGKGRVYYTRGKSRRFRILLVGAKNTQAADLDYLARLPRETYR